MNMNKLFLSVAGLALFVGYTAHAEVVQSGNCGYFTDDLGKKISDCEWTLDENGYFKTNNNYSSFSNHLVLSKDFKIPEGTITIGANSLSYLNAETITIPNTVKIIEKDAFFYSKFKSIEIPEGVTEIGDWAFGGCEFLSDIKLPESLNSMGEGVFNTDGFEIIVLPDGVVDNIGEGALTPSPTSTTIYCSTSKAETCQDYINFWSNYTGNVEIYPDYSYNKDTKEYTFFCEEGSDLCDSGIIEDLFGNKTTKNVSYTYDEENDQYIIDGKAYDSLDEMKSGYQTSLNEPPHIAKRIYTVKEATEAVSGRGKNTFSIRYR